MISSFRIINILKWEMDSGRQSLACFGSRCLLRIFLAPTLSILGCPTDDWYYLFAKGYMEIGKH